MREDYAAMLEEQHHDSTFEYFARRCESPIEVLMLGAMAYGLYRTLSTEQLPAPGFTMRGSEMSGLWVLPQYPMGQYRVDFLVIHVQEHAPKLFTRARVVVECDGHAFHDKTPEQAQRDKSRDRALLKMGFPVLRFTGSEIVRDPRACVDDVGDALSAEASRQLSAALDMGAEGD